jgi:hypothetical protein
MPMPPVAPESIPATRFTPLDEQAIASQKAFVALVCVHVIPEFVEMEIPPNELPANIVIPSDDAATQDPPCPVRIQCVPEFVET